MSKLGYRWVWQAAGGDRLLTAKHRSGWEIEFHTVSTFRGRERGVRVSHAASVGKTAPLRYTAMDNAQCWDGAEVCYARMAEAMEVHNPLEASVLASEFAELGAALDLWARDDAREGRYPGLGMTFVYLEPDPAWLAKYEADVALVREGRL